MPIIATLVLSTIMFASVRALVTPFAFLKRGRLKETQLAVKSQHLRNFKE
jgi:hypothetical protein